MDGHVDVEGKQEHQGDNTCLECFLVASTNFPIVLFVFQSLLRSEN